MYIFMLVYILSSLLNTNKAVLGAPICVSLVEGITVHPSHHLGF